MNRVLLDSRLPEFRIYAYLWPNKEHTFVESKEQSPHWKSNFNFSKLIKIDLRKSMKNETWPLHPLTIKFIKWKSFCVVHPYSGTLDWMRTNCTWKLNEKSTIELCLVYLLVSVKKGSGCDNKKQETEHITWNSVQSLTISK